MKIGITLNEVLRDFLGQLVYTYDKYYEKTDLTQDDITSFELLDYFDFKDKNELNKFLYFEASLEIFGHADQYYDNIFNRFNAFLMDMQDEEEHQIKIVSREFNKSIPSTCFFLSKVGCRATNIEFVKNYEDKWENVDVLITANPIALENKPAGKISVKVNTKYNTDVEADFSIDSIVDFMDDSSLRESILNTKITSFEEI